MDATKLQKVEEDGRAAITAQALEQHVAVLCSLGEKLAGTVEEEKACAYIMKELEAAGLQPTCDVFESYVSHPLSARLEVYFPEEFSVEGVGISFGVSTPLAGLSAPLVYAGLGSAADYKGLDVCGKIAVIGKLPNPETAMEAAAQGAIALVAMSEGHMKHKMIASPVWGNPGIDEYRNIPRIPVVSISGVDGATVRRLCKSGQAKGTVHVRNWEGWRQLRLPSVEIKGRRPEYLLVGAHYCSWFDGATDNASGNSCLIELAKLFHAQQDTLEYGVRFAWWPGHSHGRYSGSAWYVDSRWQDLYDNCIGYFNIDSPGVRGADIYVPRHQMAEVSAFNEACVAELTQWSTVKSHESQLSIGARFGKYVNATRPSRAADQSFWGVGLTSIGVYSMLAPEHPDRRKHVGGSGGAWWWHSIDDTADKCDPAVLQQDTRLFWSIIHRLLRAPGLPYDFTATVQDYLDALREYQEEAGEHFDFAPLADSLNTLQTLCGELRNRMDAETDPEKAHAETRLCLRLARALVPTLYTQVQPTDHQAALGTRFLSDLQPSLTLASLDPESWDYKFTKETLLRKRNKVVSAVLGASRLIEAWRA